jgi:DNA-binding NarL/FixJ family response regulator
LARLEQDPLGVILVDIHLPVISGIEGIKVLKSRYPSLPSLILTVFADDGHVFEAICAGDCGYLFERDPAYAVIGFDSRGA